MLYLLHHADAVSAGVDPRRPLSAAGREHAVLLSGRAAERGVKPAVVWHSGKLRARQTAEAFWRTCNPLATMAAVRGLQPSDPAEWVRDLVAEETRDVMLVGHMPNLARVLALLTTGDAAAPSDFPDHSLIALDATDGRYVERFRIV
jgi:phosphohistidine phosphatase